MLNKIKNSKLPSNQWNMLTSGCHNAPVSFYKIQDVPSSSKDHVKVSHSVFIDLDLSWKIRVHGHEVSREVCDALFDIHNMIDDCQLPKLLSQLDQINVCPGHPDKHFVIMAKSKKGKLLNSAGDVAAYIDDFEVSFENQKLPETVRTSGCLILTKNSKCSQCTSYQQTLRSLYHGWSKRQSISPSKIMNSHVNEKWLTHLRERKKCFR